MKRNILHSITLAAAFLMAAACSNSGKNTEGQDQLTFAKGADIGWATEMASEGIRFYNSAGEERECTALMKELGFDAVRFRVWVNPSDGWCGKEDVVAKAKTAKNLDMRIMINFHYSDWWADPGKQNKPEAWKDYSTEELCGAIADHTRDVLSALKDEGITPEWVQVGNETSDGMLWDTGKASISMANYAAMDLPEDVREKIMYKNACKVLEIPED